MFTRLDSLPPLALALPHQDGGDTEVTDTVVDADPKVLPSISLRVLVCLSVFFLAFPCGSLCVLVCLSVFCPAFPCVSLCV